MSTEAKNRFTVISNKNFKEEPARMTNPINYEAQDLREQLLKFRNNEGGKRFSIEELLKW